MREGREYAALWDSNTKQWYVMARDVNDYVNGYWFIYLRELSSREEVEDIADSLNKASRA